jgi:hypothetical protein
MLLEISLHKTSPSPEVTSSTVNNVCAIKHSKGNEVFIDESDDSEEFYYEGSNSSTNSDIKIFEENFGQIDVFLQNSKGFLK